MDYYVVLGIPPTASQEGVRDAFRELARRYHPDRAGPDAADTFQQILEAYEVLSDRGRRASYDARRAASRTHVGPGEPVRVRYHPVTSRRTTVSSPTSPLVTEAHPSEPEPLGRSRPAERGAPEPLRPDPRRRAEPLVPAQQEPVWVRFYRRGG